MTDRDRLSRPEEDGIEPSAALRRRVLASADPSTRFEGFVSRFARLFALAESDSRRILDLADEVEAQGWIASGLEGVRFHHFEGGPAVATADCGLVHLAPGTAFPRHRHEGDEWTFVLSGSAEEDSGEVWLPGDLIIRETGSVHGFHVLGNEPCSLAVILHGGIQPTDDRPPGTGEGIENTQGRSACARPTPRWALHFRIGGQPSRGHLSRGPCFTWTRPGGSQTSRESAGRAEAAG